MPRERRGFLRDAFHQAAVAHDRVGVVIDNAVAGPVVSCAQPLLRDGHAHRVTEPLAQRARRYFYARRVIAFGMAGRLAVELAEALQFFEREVVAGQIQKTVEQHRSVPRREDEAVAVEPIRIFRVELQELCPERVGHRGGAHRHARVPRVGVLHRVRGQDANRIDGEIFEGDGFGGRHCPRILPASIRFRLRREETYVRFRAFECCLPCRVGAFDQCHLNFFGQIYLVDSGMDMSAMPG